jgi:hypothetical protein
MHGAAWTFLLALAVKRVGDGKRFGIGLDYRAQSGAVAVDGFDPGQVLLGDGAHGELARAHAVGEVSDGDLLKILRLRGGGACQGCGGCGLAEKRSTIHVFDYIRAFGGDCGN